MNRALGARCYSDGRRKRKFSKYSRSEAELTFDIDQTQLTIRDINKRAGRAGGHLN